MRIPSGVTDQYIYFVAVDATDFTTRETGLTSFTVYRSRNGAVAAAMTTPTVNETDTTNMPGVYELLLDEDMTIGSGNDSEEMVFHITATGMAPVTRTIELYRPKITAGNTLGVASDGDISGNVDGNVVGSVGSNLELGPTEVNAEVDTALADIGLDHLISSALPTNWATDVASGSVFDNIADNGTAAFDRTTDSLQAIRDRGDTSWITGGGGGLTQSLSVTPLIPQAIDLANTATYRIGIALVNSLDDLPTTAEITPGTITIDRKAKGGTSWTNVVNAAACSEAAGLVYYDEVFDSATGYAEGDMIRITFHSQAITADSNTHEVADATEGRIFYTGILVSTPDVNVTQISGDATAADNLEADYDGTGYNKSNSTIGTTTTNTDMVAAAPTAVAIRTEIDSNSTQLAAIVADTNELQTDDVPGLIAALNDISSANVLTQVNAALDTAISELGVAAPTATPTLRTGLMFLYMALRNERTTTASVDSVKNDAGTTIATASVSDDGTTFTKGEYA